jgi:hypothetical protein
LLLKYTNRKYFRTHFRRKKKLKLLLERIKSKQTIDKNQVVKIIEEEVEIPKVETKLEQPQVEEKKVEIKNVSHEDESTQNSSAKKILAKKSSLTSIIAEINDDKNIQQKEKPELNSENIVAFWDEYISFIKPNAQNSYLNIIQNQQPVFEKNKILVTASSNINLEMMQLNKSSIITFFLEHTNTKQLELEIVLQKPKNEEPVYKVPRERAKELYESNESVRYLIQKFDLTLDA